MITKKLIEKFDALYKKNEVTGCWNWTGSTRGRGYGQFSASRKLICGGYAHRFSYLRFKGPIPKDRMICHACDNRLCVNPEHLFLGDAKVNLQDMKAKDRHLRGERNTQAKLTEAKILEIYALHDAGHSTYQIAKAYSIGQMTAWRIVNGQRWNHLYRQRRKNKS